MNYLKSILTLIKYKVSLAVTFTAITGYIIFSGSLHSQILILIVAVFTLASGSSALNECQENKYDAKMGRTKNRPIPKGDISLGGAIFISIALVFLGLSILYIYLGALPAALGLFNLIWYNLFYTNLKRISAFAVVPGSLVGAIPVLIGWTAAGGYVFDITIILIAFFLFIWQIPHFWLLMLKYGEEYKQAGFPTINQTVDSHNLIKIIYSWIIATSFTSIAIPIFLLDTSTAFFILVFILNITFILIFTRLSFNKQTVFNFKKSFISINIYMFLFMISLLVYHLLPLS